MSTENFPRRNRIDLLTPAEKAIHDAIGMVEIIGAHPQLTDVVLILSKAKDLLSDFLEANGHAKAAPAGDPVPKDPAHPHT